MTRDLETRHAAVGCGLKIRDWEQSEKRLKECVGLQDLEPK